jgi:hypothetical protein
VSTRKYPRVPHNAPQTTPAAVAPVGRGGATRTVADGVAPQRRPQSTLCEYSEYRREHSEYRREHSEYPAGRREGGRRRATARRGALQQRRRAARAGARTRRARGATLGTHVGTLTTLGLQMGYWGYSRWGGLQRASWARRRRVARPCVRGWLSLVFLGARGWLATHAGLPSVSTRSSLPSVSTRSTQEVPPGVLRLARHRAASSAPTWLSYSTRGRVPPCVL